MSNTLCWAKKTRHKRQHIIWFHLYIKLQSRPIYNDRKQFSSYLEWEQAEISTQGIKSIEYTYNFLALQLYYSYIRMLALEEAGWRIHKKSELFFYDFLRINTDIKTKTFFFFFLAALHSMSDLSSQTRDQTLTLWSQSAQS